MSAPLNIDLATATPPASVEAIGKVVAIVGEGNVFIWQPDKIAISAGGALRPASGATVDELHSFCTTLATAGDADSPPGLLSLAVKAAEGVNLTAEEVAQRQRRAVLQAVVEYLWRCTNHGGLLIAGGYLVLPTAPSTNPAASTSTAPPSTSAPAAGDSTESVTGDAGGKRKIDDVISVLDEMSERSSLAEALGQGGGATNEPATKRPLTFVSIPSKFKAAFAALLGQTDRLEQVPYMMPTQKDAVPRG